jgi:tetratricopeptide (TPR) repeat protein
MPHRFAVAILAASLVLGPLAQRAAGQNLPQACKDALEVRSPQAQIDLFTQCLETPGLYGSERASTFKQRAVAFMHLGQHQRALSDIEQAIRLKNDDADSYYLRGFAYRALGQNQRAVEDSTRAISMDSGFAAAYANRAFAYKSLGNVNAAKADARRARELDSSVKVPWF